MLWEVWEETLCSTLRKTKYLSNTEQTAMLFWIYTAIKCGVITKETIIVD